MNKKTDYELTAEDQRRIYTWKKTLKEDHGVCYPDLAAAMYIIGKIFDLDEDLAESSEEIVDGQDIQSVGG